MLVIIILLAIIHRDLKPENILLIMDTEEITQIKYTKLIDFGFAVFYNDSDLKENED